MATTTATTRWPRGTRGAAHGLVLGPFDCCTRIFRRWRALAGSTLLDRLACLPSTLAVAPRLDPIHPGHRAVPPGRGRPELESAGCAVGLLLRGRIAELGSRLHVAIEPPAHDGKTSAPGEFRKAGGAQSVVQTLRNDYEDSSHSVGWSATCRLRIVGATREGQGKSSRLPWL